MLDVLHGTGVLLIAIIGIAWLFDFTNGFHDTANAIATVVSTRVLSPLAAVGMAAVLNICGAFYSTNVAKTIAGGLVEASAATETVILSAIIGAIAWNLITWYFGIPSSSSHALVGGLVGASLAHAGAGAVLWRGVLDKVILPMVVSPLLGGVIAFAIMSLIYLIFARVRQQRVTAVFVQLQRLSAAAMSFNHGQNDAQKTMGIITLALAAHHLIPGGAKIHVPAWVMGSCALVMGLGTAAGGWRIIRTMGQRIIRLTPVHGFAAESAASIVIFSASQLGMAVSTTHVISGSIFGVGGVKRFAGVRWNIARRMVTAWLLTLPAAALVAAIAFLIVSRFP